MFVKDYMTRHPIMIDAGRRVERGLQGDGAGEASIGRRREGHGADARSRGARQDFGR